MIIFYTKKEYTNPDEYNYHLEPSAGRGAFLRLMDPKKRIGIDIEPQKKNIIKMDFLKDYKPHKNDNYLIVRNPPFGRISSIAIKFFNKCADFGECIGFIVPRTFKRISIQNKLNLYFHLVYSEDLPLEPCCFRPKMSAKCCFQIWIKKLNHEKK